MNATDQMEVLAAINVCVDHTGTINDAGISLLSAYYFALRNSGCDDAVLSMARRIKSEATSLRSAGRVPVIYGERRRTAAARPAP